MSAKIENQILIHSGGMLGEYYIMFDGLNFMPSKVVNRMKGGKNGAVMLDDNGQPVTKEVNYGFYPTLAGALDKIIKLRMLTEKGGQLRTMTLMAFVSEYKKMMIEFRKEFLG